MGKIDTTTMLLIGAAVVAVYLVTKKPAAATAPVYYPPAYNPYGQPQATAPGNTTGGIITAAGGVLDSIFKNIDF